MNVTCDVIADLLPLYFDGVASEDTKRVISAHLKRCRACRDSLRAMKAKKAPRSARTHLDGMADYAALAKRMRARRTTVYSAGGTLLLMLLGYSVYKTAMDMLPDLQMQ